MWIPSSLFRFGFYRNFQTNADKTARKQTRGWQNPKSFFKRQNLVSNFLGRRIHLAERWAVFPREIINCQWGRSEFETLMETITSKLRKRKKNKIKISVDQGTLRFRIAFAPCGIWNFRETLLKSWKLNSSMKTISNETAQNFQTFFILKATRTEFQMGMSLRW